MDGNRSKGIDSLSYIEEVIESQLSPIIISRQQVQILVAKAKQQNPSLVVEAEFDLAPNSVNEISQPLIAL